MLLVPVCLFGSASESVRPDRWRVVLAGSGNILASQTVHVSDLGDSRDIEPLGD